MGLEQCYWTVIEKALDESPKEAHHFTNLAGFAQAGGHDTKPFHLHIFKTKTSPY